MTQAGRANVSFGPHSPSTSMLSQLMKSLAAFAPFASMTTDDLRLVIQHATQHYFETDQTVLSPSDGPVSAVLIIRSGSITGQRGVAEVAGMAGAAIEYEAGDMFPVSAALSSRAVSAHYTATSDTFVWSLPVEHVQALAKRSPVFADFLNGRVMHFLQLSREALQQSYAARSMMEQSLERPLSQAMRKQPINCLPSTPLREALSVMHQRRVGSMLVVDADQCLAGILTRYDILGKITLPSVSLDVPISGVMTQPVHSLTAEHTAQDAALMMSRLGIRHVPVTQAGRLVGIVSERDLFALQRLSIKQLSSEIRAAIDVTALVACAQSVRELAKDLLAQGVHSRQITGLISHLNDVLTQQIIVLIAKQFSINSHEFCWLALGSEGRGEQTIATDQDNALILPNEASDAELARAQAMAWAVNEALDRCGFPLCEGGIMAGHARCCMRLGQWQQRFSDWIQFGTPEHLLNASIFFDFRAISGRTALAEELRAHLTPLAKGHPRFLNLLATQGLSIDVPLNWRGAIDGTQRNGLTTLDLKLQATALVVSAARVYALAHGIEATGTAQRLALFGAASQVPRREYEAWVTGFEFLQSLRLRVQLELGSVGEQSMALAVSSDEPNRLNVTALNDVDRRILKESLRVSRGLQQRLRMDHAR